MRSDGDSILLMGRHQLKGLRWLNNSVSISSITTYVVPVPDLHVAYFCIIFNFNRIFFIEKLGIQGLAWGIRLHLGEEILQFRPA